MCMGTFFLLSYVKELCMFPCIQTVKFASCGPAYDALIKPLFLILRVYVVP